MLTSHQTTYFAEFEAFSGKLLRFIQILVGVEMKVGEEVVRLVVHGTTFGDSLTFRLNDVHFEVLRRFLLRTQTSFFGK